MHDLPDPQTIITLLTGILLALSEVLPFLETDSNGILHLLTAIGKKFVSTKASAAMDVLDESTPLLTAPVQQPQSTQNIVIDFEAITTTLSQTTQETLEVIRSQHSLKPPSTYQLEYIINFIRSNSPKKSLDIKDLDEGNKKSLEARGYVVRYNSLLASSVIEW